jgi:hypothetical protein
MTFWRSIIFCDGSKVGVWVGLRNALGVAITLAAGYLLGRPAGGAVAC